MENEKEIIERLTKAESNVKSNQHRIDRHEKQLDEFLSLTASIQALTVNIEQFAKELKRQGDRLERLEQIPASRMEKINTTVISCVVSALCGAILANIIK